MPTVAQSRALALSLLALAAVGAGTSALLLHEYLDPSAGACGPDGGCAAVRQSALANPMGVPLPALGLLFFIAMGVAVVHPGLRKRRAAAWLGAVGALCGAGFLATQAWVIGAWCPYCVVVDVFALGLGLAVCLPTTTTDRRLFRPTDVIALSTTGLAIPMAVGVMLRPTPPPPAPAQTSASVASATVDGQTTIVEFIDFQCPYCRRQHQRLAKILGDYGDRVHVQTHHFPLDGIHPLARHAARVASCAQEQGLHDTVIDALMRADDLSPEGCHDTARVAGVDPSRLDQCLASPRPDAHLRQDANEASANGVRSLPTCFIGGQRFEGLRSEETLRDAIDQALSRGPAPT